MPSISVIVPVYQAEKFLHRCVDSVCRQTFSDWELILVDDGSTDGSPALCDKLAARDSRVRVFHRKKNQGVSEARNLGINEAKGNYIAFLDADDCYEFHALETLWNLREQSGADAAACGLTYLFPDGKQSVQSQLPAGIFGQAEIREKLIDPLVGTGWPSQCSTATACATSSPRTLSAKPPRLRRALSGGRALCPGVFSAWPVLWR